MNQPGNWFKGMLLQVHVIKFKRAVVKVDLTNQSVIETTNLTINLGWENQQLFLV